jgi:exodeoxyribonuclease VII small subunit
MSGERVEALSFEQALAELQTIVERLQRPDVPLDEAVALYRRGTELAQRSEELLGAAELQVQQLTSAVRERFAAYEAEDEVGEDTDEDE